LLSCVLPHQFAVTHAKIKPSKQTQPAGASECLCKTGMKMHVTLINTSFSYGLLKARNNII